ncbi:MAG: phosphotransferase [Desulfobulbaceae bacterium]|nr:phosphotransferase [Desulfobulbaceae bacterium]
MDFFENPICKLFFAEIRSLGFIASRDPIPGAKPYAVIGGRSNVRWWLVPLTNRNVTTSGLALFQPIIPSAKILKTAATALSAVGLASLWARKLVYVLCPPVFSDLFSCSDLTYAFFTGTDSPHRKTTVQIMGADGGIKGFAKISLSPKIKELIAHEANCIDYVQSLRLESCCIPKMLLSAEISGAQILVTNTEKTRYSKSPTVFMALHKGFLSELMSKSTKDKETLAGSQFLLDIRKQAEQYSIRLPTGWNTRFAEAFSKISSLAPTIKAEIVFCHGDFTPWNTFMVNNRLYVFDWEYAHKSYPPGYDLIHFTLSLPESKRRPSKTTIRLVRKLLTEMGLTENDAEADVLFLCYLCGHSLQYIAREPYECGKLETWDGEPGKADFIDTIIRWKTE